MNNNIAVRSMLVDTQTGKYIKAINETSWDNFIQLITKPSQDAKITMFDMSPIIEFFNKQLSNYEDNEILIKRSTIFNSWQRFKTLTSESIINHQASNLMNDCEEFLNRVHMRFPNLQQNYPKNESSYNYTSSNDYQKSRKLEELRKEVDIFIEILLCNIHVTAIVDLNSFKNDTILIGHCYAVYRILQDCINFDIDYYSNDFKWESLIYQCCMEDMGINPDALLKMCNINKTAQDIKNEVCKTKETRQYFDNYGNSTNHVRSIEWSIACPHKLERTKLLLITMQKVLAVIDLLEKLKSNDVVFNKNNENNESFKENITSLIESMTPKSHRQIACR